MLKIIFSSLIISLLTLLVLVVLPFNISGQSSVVGPSPYRAQIDELYAETNKGLPPDAPEWSQLEELKRKNNDWFENDSNFDSSNSDLGLVDVLRGKSSKLSLLLMFIWMIGFYFLFGPKPRYSSAIVLLFPVIFFISNILSLLALILIFTGVVSVYMFVFLKERQAKGGGLNPEA